MAKPNPIFEKLISEDGLQMLYERSREGLTDEQISSEIGITSKTLYKWMKKAPEIRDKLQEGRRKVTVRVEDAFYSRCEWQDLEEVTTEVVEDGAGNVISRHTKTVKKRLPPDVTALIFALKKLAPMKWGDSSPFVEEAEERHNAIVEAIKGGMEK